MATMRVVVQRNDNLTRFPVIFREEATKFMRLAVEKVLSTAQPKVPVDTGVARGSLQAKVESPSQLIVTGSVGSVNPYFIIIEEGRRPGARQPPSVALQGWVRRKLRLIDPRQVRAAAYLIARAIGRRGIPAKRPLGKAAEENQSFVRQLFEFDLPAAIAKRL